MRGDRLGMRPVFAVAVATFAAVLATAGPGISSRTARPESVPLASAGAGHAAHSLVAIEFHEWPPSELSVSGGFLGVPDSAGRFPKNFRRFDPTSGQTATPGSGAGNLLVFTDVKPGTYRAALILLDQSRTMRRLLGPRGLGPTEDVCLVYGDTASALTFTVGARELRFLGRITRRTLPSLDSTEVWRSTTEWSPGDEARAVKTLLKRKQFTAWRDLLASRAAALDSASASRRRRKG